MGRRGPGVTRGRKTYNEFKPYSEIHLARYQFPPRFRYLPDHLARPLTAGVDGVRSPSPDPPRAA